MPDEEKKIIRAYSNENLEILPDADGSQFYSEDQIDDYVKDNAGITYQDTVDAQNSGDVEVNITDTEQVENVQTVYSDGVQKFEGYYSFTAKDFEDEFSKAFRSAIIQTYVTGLVPRLTSDLIHSVGRDQTKDIVGKMLKRSKPSPDYKVNLGLRKKDQAVSTFDGDFSWFKDVQNFRGLHLVIPEQDPNLKKDPASMQANITGVDFSLTNLKSITTGTGQSWKELREFIDLYMEISKEQADGKAIDVEALVEFEASDTTLLNLFSNSNRYNYQFKFEQVRIKDVGFKRLSRFTNNRAAVANFRIEGIVTSVNPVKKDQLKKMRATSIGEKQRLF